jgi:hypothetical protein
VGGTQRLDALCPGAHGARVGTDFIVWQNRSKLHLLNLPSVYVDLT